MNTVVYMDVKKNVPKPDEVLLLKKYIAWHFDQHAKKDPETMCVVLLDMTGASVGNLVSGIRSFGDDVPLDDYKIRVAISVTPMNICQT